MYLGNLSGHTLTEVLISMVILAVGMLGIAPLINMAFHGNEHSTHLLRADALAQEELENMISSMSESSLSLYQQSESLPDGYVIRRSIANPPISSVADNLRQLTVAVYWTDVSNQKDSLTYTTLISAPDFERVTK